jgi:hypothetical protein
MKKFLLTLFAMFASMVSAGAYDFMVDGIYYDINEDGTTLAIVPDESYKDFTGDLVLPDTVTYNGAKYTVTSIKNEAFKNCNGLTSVTLSSTVTTVGMMAFDHCVNLETLNIGTSFNMWGSSPFSNCKNVKTVNWNARKIHPFSSYHASPLLGYSNVTTFNVGPDVEEIPENLLYSFFSLNTINWNARNCANSPFATLRDDIKALVKTVNIGDSVRSIPHSFIAGMKNVEILSIGKSVTSIGDSAFIHCANITSAVFNNNLKEIGSLAFAYCVRLSDVYIGDSVKSIGQFAFGACHELRSIALPETLTEISFQLFGYCAKLSKVNIPSNVTSIGAYAFDECSSLSVIEIPETVSYIGRYAFSGTRIESFVVPELVTTIESGAFSYNGHLKNISLHKNITAIKDDAFSSCTGLIHFSLPVKVETIEHETFAYCESLESISIPDGVTSIGWAAFSACWKLKNIYCYAATPLVVSDGSDCDLDAFWRDYYQYWYGDFSAFHGVNMQNCTVYVPKGSGESYRNARYWGYFNIVEADMSGVDEINCVKPADGPAQRYNVLGQPVGDDYHGIVIENGKKILVP